MPSDFPLWAVDEDSPFYASVAKFTGLHFYGFTEANWEAVNCPNNKQRAIGINLSPDYLPLQQFYDTVMEDQDRSQMAWILPPLEGWENPTDCVQFVCTAPENVVLKFYDSDISGEAIEQF